MLKKIVINNEINLFLFLKKIMKSLLCFLLYRNLEEETNESRSIDLKSRILIGDSEICRIDRNNYQSILIEIWFLLYPDYKWLNANNVSIYQKNTYHEFNNEILPKNCIQVLWRGRTNKKRKLLTFHIVVTKYLRVWNGTSFIWWGRGQTYCIDLDK